MKRTALTLTLALGFLSAPLAHAQTVVKIGAIFPLSGPLASTGVELKQAIELAEDLINGTSKDLKGIPLAGAGGLPGLKGAKLNVVFADSQGKPEIGQTEAERLISQEKVVALTGAYQSAVTRTASRVAEQAGIPFVNGESSSPDLTERGYKYFFRTSPNDDTFISNMMTFLSTIRGRSTKNIAVVYENTDFGVNTSKSAAKFAAATGRQIVADIAYTAGTASVSSEVQRLAAAKADVVIFASYTSDALLFVRTMRQVNYAPPILLANDAGFIDSRFLQEVGSQVPGVLTRDVWGADLADTKPIIGVINKLYRAKYGKDLNGNNARSLQGLLVLAYAINRAGSTDPEKIRAALVALNLGASQVIMPWSGVKFDDKGQNIKGEGIIAQWDGTKYNTVWPAKLASQKGGPKLPFVWGK